MFRNVFAVRFVCVVLFIFCSTFLRSFAAEAEKCPKGQFFVRAHHRRAYVTSSGKHVRATHVKSHCKILSPSNEFWLPRLKDGMPPNWPHKGELPASWSAEQKERFLEAMEGLPELLEIGSIEGVYRLESSKDGGNPASHGDGMIVIYDNAFGPKRDLGRIVAHEAAHEMYDRLGEKDAYDYRKSTGWTMGLDGRKIYWEGRKSGYIEEDGRLSPAEDYANNVEGYVYDPDRLKRTTPEAYNWIKRRHGDKLKPRGK